MKIIMLCADFWPHLGGVEKHVLRVSQELITQGHQVSVLTYQRSRSASEVSSVPVQYLSATSRNQKLATWRQLWQMRTVFDQADVIHIHDIAWWLWPFWWRWWRKIWITFHGWETQWPIPFAAKLQRWLAAISSRGSLHVGAWIAQFYFDKPDFVIYGGVDTLPEMKSVRLHQPLRVLFLGRLSDDNQITWYLEFISTLKALRSIQVVWIGEGEYSAAVSQSGQVLGAVANPTEFLKDADLVMANSYLSILEAQALGKVVIAAKAHPLKAAYLDSYPGKKWLVMGADPQQTAQKVDRLLNEPSQWHARCVAAQNWAQQQTWEQVTKVYLQLWGGYEV